MEPSLTHGVTEMVGMDTLTVTHKMGKMSAGRHLTKLSQLNLNSTTGETGDLMIAGVKTGTAHIKISDVVRQILMSKNVKIINYYLSPRQESSK